MVFILRPPSARASERFPGVCRGPPRLSPSRRSSCTRRPAADCGTRVRNATGRRVPQPDEFPTARSAVCAVAAIRRRNSDEILNVEQLRDPTRKRLCQVAPGPVRVADAAVVIAQLRLQLGIARRCLEFRLGQQDRAPVTRHWPRHVAPSTCHSASARLPWITKSCSPSSQRLARSWRPPRQTGQVEIGRRQVRIGFLRRLEPQRMVGTPRGPPQIWPCICSDAAEVAPGVRARRHQLGHLAQGRRPPRRSCRAGTGATPSAVWAPQ